MNQINPGASAPVSEFVEWDDEVMGLGRRWRAASAPRWIIQTRVEGRCRKRVIGDADAISVIDARLAARAMLARIAEAAPEEEADAPDPMATVADFAARWLEDRANAWKPSTARAHKRQMDGQIIPAFGARRVRDIRKIDVTRWRAALTCAPGSANRALAVLSGMMRHAELLGLIPSGSNPCMGLRRKEAKFSARYLSPVEYRRLDGALDQCGNRNPAATDLIRFIALTGCRKSEARLLQWDWVEGNAARLPDSKTGPASIWFGAPVRALLDRRGRNGAYVFSRDDDGAAPISVGALSYFWRRVRKAARLERVRIHDLQHSFASVAAKHKESLRTIGGLLGHSDLATTEGYAHLGEEDIREAADQVGEITAEKITQPRNPRAVSGAIGRKRKAAAQLSKEQLANSAATERALRREASPELRAFFASGKSFRRFCAAKGYDADVLGLELDAYREALTRLTGSGCRRRRQKASPKVSAAVAASASSSNEGRL